MTRENKELVRGDKQSLVFTYSGDLSARKLIFVMKASRSLTASRLIEKKNTAAGGGDTELTATYSASTGLTTITVIILKANTSALSAQTYYYDITSEAAGDAADHTTILTGKAYLIADVQTPTDGSVVINLDTSRIRYVYPGDTVKSVVDAFSDEAIDNVYTVIVFAGSTMGASFENRPYINYLWLASGVDWDFNEADMTSMNLSNQDFTDADFTNCDLTSCVFKGMIADGADFTGATISLTKAQFQNELGHWDADTTWTDGSSLTI